MNSVSTAMTRTALRHIVVPVTITVVLVAWLFARVSPRQLVAAASELDWIPLSIATGVMVIALYLWDSACLTTVYSIHHNRWSFRESLRLRGLSYLLGCVNYEFGQAALAWELARMQKTGVVRMLSRSVLLAYHDIFVLLAVSLTGSLLTDDPRMTRLRPYLAIALFVAITIALVFKLLPQGIRERFRRKDSESFLEGWSIGRSLRLLGLRCVYFGFQIIYAATALQICKLPVDFRVTTSAIPLVLLANGLPSFAGIGTHETSMQLLLAPGREQAPVLLAMSLFWTTGLVICRMGIALANLWIGKIDGGPSIAFATTSDAAAPKPTE